MVILLIFTLLVQTPSSLQAHPIYVHDFEGFDTNFRPVDMEELDGKYYLANDWTGQMDIYTKNGTLLSSHGSLTQGMIGGIANNATHIFISDRSNNEIKIFTLDGTFAGNISNLHYNGDPTPENMWVNETHLVVGSYDTVDFYHLNGTLAKSIGWAYASGPGEFKVARDIEFNSTHMFVADLNNERVQIFDLAGNYVSEFPSQANIYSGYEGPWGIELTDEYIITAHLRKINFYDYTGTFLFYIGDPPNVGGNEFICDAPEELCDVRDVISNSTHYIAPDQGGRVVFYEKAPLTITETETNTETNTETQTSTAIQTQTVTETSTSTETQTETETATETQTDTATEVETIIQNTTIISSISQNFTTTTSDISTESVTVTVSDENSAIYPGIGFMVCLIVLTRRRK